MQLSSAFNGKISNARYYSNPLPHWKSCSVGDYTYVLLIVVGLPPDRTVAATLIWDGPATGGDFQDAANWSVVSPPGPPSPQNNDFTIISSVDGTITYSASTAVIVKLVFSLAITCNTILDIGAGKTHTTTSLFLVGSGGVQSGRDDHSAAH